MQKKEIDLNEIIKVEQMPKIFSQLELLGKEIDKKLEGIDKMECTEENKKEIKQIRADINKTQDILEVKRKEVQKAILEPYNIFVEKYNKECKEKLQNASSILKSKIDEIEQVQKSTKEEELKDFAREQFEYYKIENIVKFEDMHLNITLSASIKSLKEEIVDFSKKISYDLECISSEEKRDEILYEYQNNGFNYQNAILTIRKRENFVKEQQQKQQELEEQKKQEQQIEQKVEEALQEVQIPTEIEEEETEEKYTVQFTVTASKDQILKLKEFLKKEGIDYE